MKVIGTRFDGGVMRDEAALWIESRSNSFPVMSGIASAVPDGRVRMANAIGSASNAVILPKRAEWFSRLQK